MRALCLFIVIFIYFAVKCFTSQVKQVGGTVNYCNTKYVTECYGITRRVRRGEPYKTNFTATTRYPWGNNVTMKVELVGAISMELVKIKLCDAQKIDWLYDYLKTYARIDDGQCPYKPGQYGLFNMDFPPKNLPLRIRNIIFRNFHTKLTSKFYFIITKTEEIIIECTINHQAV